VNKLFTWDDLDCEIKERDPEDNFRCNAEGGWDSLGFITAGDEGEPIPYGSPCVEVRDCGRFISLETWCANEEEAEKLFSIHERFVQVMTENDE